MKLHFFYSIILILIIFNYSENQNISLYPNSSSYYEEKYFRILSNNYDTIDPGTPWSKDDEDYGFKAKKDFGSLIFLKDWSMYNFKLIKVIFKNVSSFNYVEDCDAEMWLIHTKDNGYYPPGRRIFMKQNYFTIIVPFKRTSNSNPAIDSIFDFLRLKDFSNNINNNNISPSKPVKLYQIIQNQPGYLFEGEYKSKEMLFMVFSQYHYISEDDKDCLDQISFNIKTNVLKHENQKIYRNVKHIEDIKQKVSLMIYSKANFLKNMLSFFIIFIA